MSSFHRIQNRLEAYRRQKAAEKEETPPKEVTDVATDAVLPPPHLAATGNGQNRVAVTSSIENEEETVTNETQPFNWLTFTLKLLLWVLLFGLFIEIGFGQVYFIASGLFFMVYFLKGSRRRRGELSAYSVFNKNQERLDGTFSAEQIERELRYGPGAVR